MNVRYLRDLRSDLRSIRYAGARRSATDVDRAHIPMPQPIRAGEADEVGRLAQHPSNDIAAEALAPRGLSSST